MVVAIAGLGVVTVDGVALVLFSENQICYRIKLSRNSGINLCAIIFYSNTSTHSIQS